MSTQMSQSPDLEWNCSHCKITVSGEADAECPSCHRPWKATPKRLLESEEFGAQLLFVQYRCDKCGAAFLLDSTARCPKCGYPESAAPDHHAAARISAFSPTIEPLMDRARRYGDVAFVTRGQRVSFEEYTSALQPNFTDAALDFLEVFKGIFSTTDWEHPDSQTAQSAVQRAADRCAATFDRADQFAATPPPLGLLAVHRRATRALIMVAQAMTSFLSTAIAPTWSEALQRREVGQELLDGAGVTAGSIGDLLDRLSRVVEEPGWWTIEDEHDAGRVSWEAVGAQTTSIEDAAVNLRRDFAAVPGVSTISDPVALLLLPLQAIGLVFHDPDRLTSRAKAAQYLLANISAGRPDWIADPPLLVDELVLGGEQLQDQVVRLGFEMRRQTPRKLLMQTALDVYSKLLEGPLRHLGGILAVAASSEADLYNSETVGRQSARAVLRSLSEKAPMLVEGFQELVRNAEAHYDFLLLDDGVLIRHTRPGSSSPPKEERFTDDDFLEQVINVNEALLAMQLALIPWASTPGTVTEAILEHHAATSQAKREVARALAGLSGWTDLTFSVANGTLLLDGVYRGTERHPLMSLLPTIAGIWQLFEVDEVVLPTRKDVPGLPLRREDFSSDEPEYGPASSFHARLMRGVALHEETDASERRDLDRRYGILPPVLAMLHQIQQSLDDPTRRALIDLHHCAEQAMRVLDELEVAPEVDSLRQEAWQQSNQLRQLAGPWLAAVAGRQRSLTARMAKRSDRLIDSLTRIADRCQSDDV
jgi:ribosomal protein L37E